MSDQAHFALRGRNPEGLLMQPVIFNVEQVQKFE
jgi:hypothetical protein